MDDMIDLPMMDADAADFEDWMGRGSGRVGVTVSDKGRPGGVGYVGEGSEIRTISQDVLPPMSAVAVPATVTALTLFDEDERFRESLELFRRAEKDFDFDFNILQLQHQQQQDGSRSGRNRDRDRGSSTSQVADAVLVEGGGGGGPVPVPVSHGRPLMEPDGAVVYSEGHQLGEGREGGQGGYESAGNLKILDSEMGVDYPREVRDGARGGNRRLSSHEEEVLASSKATSTAVRTTQAGLRASEEVERSTRVAHVKVPKGGGGRLSFQQDVRAAAERGRRRGDNVATPSELPLASMAQVQMAEGGTGTAAGKPAAVERSLVQLVDELEEEDQVFEFGGGTNYAQALSHGHGPEVYIKGETDMAPIMIRRARAKTDAGSGLYGQNEDQNEDTAYEVHDVSLPTLRRRNSQPTLVVVAGTPKHEGEDAGVGVDVGVRVGANSELGGGGMMVMMEEGYSPMKTEPMEDELGDEFNRALRMDMEDDDEDGEEGGRVVVVANHTAVSRRRPSLNVQGEKGQNPTTLAEEDEYKPSVPSSSPSPSSSSQQCGKKYKWSEHETKALLRACKNHGVGNWKAIKSAEPILAHRTAAELKERFKLASQPSSAKKKPKSADERHAGGSGGGGGGGGSGRGGSVPSRRERRAFTKEEDLALKRGFDKYGPSWAAIAKNPVLANRKSTDLRDRFRNAFPKLYVEAGYKPRAPRGRRKSETTNSKAGQFILDLQAREAAAVAAENEERWRKDPSSSSSAAVEVEEEGPIGFRESTPVSSYQPSEVYDSQSVVDGSVGGGGSGGGWPSPASHCLPWQSPYLGPTTQTQKQVLGETSAPASNHSRSDGGCLSPGVSQDMSSNASGSGPAVAAGANIDSLPSDMQALPFAFVEDLEERNMGAGNFVFGGGGQNGRLGALSKLSYTNLQALYNDSSEPRGGPYNSHFFSNFVNPDYQHGVHHTSRSTSVADTNDSSWSASASASHDNSFASASGTQLSSMGSQASVSTLSEEALSSFFRMSEPTWSKAFDPYQHEGIEFHVAPWKHRYGSSSQGTSSVGAGNGTGTGTGAGAGRSHSLDGTGNGNVSMQNPDGVARRSVGGFDHLHDLVLPHMGPDTDGVGLGGDQHGRSVSSNGKSLEYPMLSLSGMDDGTEHQTGGPNDVGVSDSHLHSHNQNGDVSDSLHVSSPYHVEGLSPIFPTGEWNDSPITSSLPLPDGPLHPPYSPHLLRLHEIQTARNPDILDNDSHMSGANSPLPVEEIIRSPNLGDNPMRVDTPTYLSDRGDPGLKDRSHLDYGTIRARRQQDSPGYVGLSALVGDDGHGFFDNRGGRPG